MGASDRHFFRVDALSKAHTQSHCHVRLLCPLRSLAGFGATLKATAVRRAWLVTSCVMRSRLSQELHGTLCPSRWSVSVSASSPCGEPPRLASKPGRATMRQTGFFLTTPRFGVILDDTTTHNMMSRRAGRGGEWQSGRVSPKGKKVACKSKRDRGSLSNKLRGRSDDFSQRPAYLFG